MTKNNRDRSGLIKQYIISIMMVLLAGGTMPVAAGSDTYNGSERDRSSSTVLNPGSDLWREVRQRSGSVAGNTQVKGIETGIMINADGESWRLLRVEKIIPYSGYLLAVTLFVLIAFRIIRGQVKIEAGRSGKKLLRFTLNQRTVHWVVAILFVILGLTGIIQLLGRTLLIPVMGNSVFGVIAATGKNIHDYLGPVFAIALIFMFFSFIKGNFLKLKDLSWFLNGGGMLGKHASAGRYNAGEKSWFWLAMLGGAAIVVSGLVLDFPIFGQSRETMEFYLIVHAVAAMIVLAAALGHIYMGTVAMEGALESMTTGYCDSNWAKEHHDRWYAKSMNVSEGSSSDKTINKKVKSHRSSTRSSTTSSMER